MPFLTELDERAQVKGSRDPLGLVPLWSRFGREVVGNLTTVTNSVRGFTTLLIGFELADMLREHSKRNFGRFDTSSLSYTTLLAISSLVYSRP